MNDTRKGYPRSGASSHHMYQGEKRRLLEHEKEEYDFEESDDAINTANYADGRVTYRLVLSVIVSLFGSFQYGCKFPHIFFFFFQF